MRGPLLAVCLAGAAVIAQAGPASAASLRFQAPQPGSSVSSGDVPIVVSVERGLGESVTGVQVRLRPDGGAALDGGRVLALSCVDAEGCGNVGDTQESWGGVRLAPDATPFTDTEVCNGAYLLEARTEGATTWAASSRVVLTDDVSPPTGVGLDARDGEVTVTWSRVTTPDLRIVVQRRSGSGAWTERAEVAADAGRFVEQVVAGTYEYRVVAVRGDGWVDGAPVAPCADDDRDLVAAAPARSVTVAGDAGRPLPPTASPSPAAGEGSGSGATESPTGSAGGGGGSEGDGTSSQPEAAPPPGRRIAAPPPAQGTAPRASAPGLGAAADAPRGERFFGESSGYTEELAYDGVDPVRDIGAAAQVGGLPGAFAAVSTLDVDLRRILTSVAAGLVMITLALHLRRWSREA